MVTDTTSWSFVIFEEWKDTVLQMYPCATFVELSTAVHALVPMAGVLGELPLVIGMHRKDNSAYVTEDDRIPLGCEKGLE